LPWIVPSHQAPVLPLKLWRPAWFSGLALVLGTTAPDLVFILRLDENGTPPGHTFLGQLLITVPLVLVLHTLATALVLPWLLPRLPGGAPLHLHALAGCQSASDPASFARVAFSGLVGGLTHVVIDGFTHGDEQSWPRFLPLLAAPVSTPFGVLPFYEVLQVVLTVVLGVAALRSWDRMVRAPREAGVGVSARPVVRPAPLAIRRATAACLLLAAVVGAALAPLAKGALDTADAPKLAAYGAINACCAAAIAGALVDRLRRVLDRVRLDVRIALGA